MTTDPIDFARAWRRAWPRCASARAQDARSTPSAMLDPDAARRPDRDVAPVTGGAVHRRLLAIETSCDETAVAVVERGRRIHADVVASQVALHARDRRHRAGGGGARPPALDDPGARRGLPARGCGGAGGHRRHRGDRGSGPRRLAAGGHHAARTLAWLHDLPLVPVNHHEGHLYAAWLLDPDEPERPEPELPVHRPRGQRRPHVPGARSATTSTTCAWAAPCDDAAGEAFDKVGRMLGLPYPGGPAIAAAARARDAPRPAVPACVAGRDATTSASAASRPRRGGPWRRRWVAGGRRRARWGARFPPTRWRSSPGRSRTSVVEVLATKTLRAAQRHGARSIVMGGGVAANAGAPGAGGRGRRRAGHPAGRAAAGPVHGQRRDDRRRRLAAVPRGRACRRGPRRAAVAAAGRLMPRRAPSVPSARPARRARQRPSRRRDRRALPASPRPGGHQAVQPEPPRGRRGAGRHHRGGRASRPAARCWRSGRASAS